MSTGFLPARVPLLLGALTLSGLLLTGCGSSGSATTSSSRQPVAVSSSRTWTPSEAATQLRAAADDWANTPHDLGGTSQRGVDCSGLVQSVYTNRFDVSVPRTTEKQVHAGTRVQRSKLQPGDLVFFRPSWKQRHVGIYLSDGDFLHASSSNGVSVSSLQNDYWTERWWQARRLLSFSSEDPDVAPSSSGSNTSPSRTSGW